MTQEQAAAVDEEDKKVLMIHPDRGTADPKEGFRRGSRGALRKSCDDCTASKTKCQGSIPCDRCKKRRIECKFSKRRRCGPKARAEDEKRPRTSTGAGASHPSHLTNTGYGSPETSSVHQQQQQQQQLATTPQPNPTPLPPISSLESGGGGGGGSGDLPPGDPKFCGPLNSDGLSGLAELIAPTLSDTGGSGSSLSASISASITSTGVDSSAYGHHVAAQSSRYAPLPGMPTDGMSSFLGGGGTSPPNRGGGGGLPASSSAALAGLSSLSATPDNHSRSMRQQGSARGGRASLTASQSAPSGSMSSCPPQDLPARAKSLGDIGIQETGSAGGGHMGFYTGRTSTAGSIGNDLIGVGGGGGGGRRQHAPLAVRGALPMTLDARSKAHLTTFMRTVGSLVLLPGNDAIRDAISGDVRDSEMPDAESAGSAAGVENDGKAGGVPGGHQPAAGDGDGGDDGGVVDTFVEACRAEAWAAAAVGAQFSGAREQEGKEYVSRALRSMSRCLDAPLPEVAAVMILLALFWTHSMDTRKVARYFGFAQQVGLELGDHMPEGLRYTMAFVSSLVTMTLNLDQGASFALEVKPHAVWGVSLRNSSRPGVDPFVRALAAATVACNEMLHDGAGRASQMGRMGVGDLPPPPVPPSQVLTDLLTAAAKAMGKAEVQNGEQDPEHMVAILHGLKGYTCAARGELEEAEDAARLMLNVVDTHPAMLHLPLTYTLAEASRRLLKTTAERSSRPADSGQLSDVLRGARATLVFARPAAGGGTAAAGGGGGWCAFGDEILSAFDRVSGGDGGDVSGEANGDKGRPRRSGSMSPPPRRSARPLPRAVIASQQWKPATGGAGGGGNGGTSTSPGGSRRPALDPPPPPSSSPPSPLPRWSSIPTATLPAVSASAAAVPSDWVDRVRKMPTIAPPRTSSPNVVHRMGGATRTPSPHQDGAAGGGSAASLSLLDPGPGPMPSSAPSGGVKYVSEPPDNLALLSTVATPGGYNGPPRRASYEDRGSRQRRTGPAAAGNGAADRDGDDRDGDDLPPPANPGLTTGMSFDPNRDDGTFPFM
eukprot:g7012.t1